MIDGSHNEYRPDVVSPPGKTLKETLKMIGMTQRELALRTGRPIKTINEIIKGKSAITPETALHLERALQVPATFWMNRERDYREFLARQIEHNALQKNVTWLKQLPVKEMVRYGWIKKITDPAQQVKEVLNFFGVRSPRAYLALWKNMEFSFKMSPSFKVSRDALAAWLREGELEAQKIECADYNEESFRQTLLSIRELTLKSPEVFQPELMRRCAKCGVAVVFVPELPKTRTSGATRWLTSEKALIQLSFRHKTDDMLWFTFFHEAGHILLHGKRAVFLDNDNYESDNEQAANRFAEGVLIPPDHLRSFRETGKRSTSAVLAFAANLGISPGIVVGRLQHSGDLPRSHLNDLKTRLRWSV